MAHRLFSILALGALLGTAAAVAGCGGTQQPALSYGESARRDYERAQAAFEDDDCLTATPLFQNVRREYPYSRYAALSELRIADCELRQQHYTEAIRGYRAFIRQRPTHAEVDTANFSIARAYFQQIPQDFFLSPPPEERDQAATRSALRVVRRFLLDFPESDHVAEARRIERQVLALLARHELYVADYYLKRDRPEATISRVQTLLSEYEGSGVEPEALMLMGRTYLHMRREREARLAFGEIVDRFPRTGFRVQACEYLRTLGQDCDEPQIDTGGELEADPMEGAPRRRGRDLTPGLAPGTDIDDVTGDTGHGPGTRGDDAVDTYEDASEAGIEVRPGQGVDAGDLEEGETAGEILEEDRRQMREEAAEEVGEEIRESAPRAPRPRPRR